MNSLEHVNVTVTEPQRTADLLCDIFDWQIRWQGATQNDGYTVHVGQADAGDSYLALYQARQSHPNKQQQHQTVCNLNHVAVVVDDLDQIESRVKAQDIECYNYGDYDPGKRFYFNLPDQLEVEVVAYPVTQG